MDNYSNIYAKDLLKDLNNFLTKRKYNIGRYGSVTRHTGDEIIYTSILSLAYPSVQRTEDLEKEIVYFLDQRKGIKCSYKITENKEIHFYINHMGVDSLRVFFTKPGF